MISTSSKNKIKLLTNSTKVQVRFSETDPLGIVWHGNFIKFMEDGREAFGKQFGLSYLDVYNHKFATPLVNVNIDYKRTVKYGDTIIVETFFIPNAAAKIIFNYNIYRESDNLLVATAQTTQVFINMDHELMITNPSFFEEWKKKNLLID